MLFLLFRLTRLVLFFGGGLGWSLNHQQYSMRRCVPVGVGCFLLVFAEMFSEVGRFFSGISVGC